MSLENVEIVRRIYEAVARRDTGALEFYAADVEFDFSRSPYGSVVLGRTVYRGHEGLRDFFRERYEAWEKVWDGFQELVEVGDEVISVVTSGGIGRESGLEIEQTHSRSGRFTRARSRRCDGSGRARRRSKPRSTGGGPASPTWGSVAAGVAAPRLAAFLDGHGRDEHRDRRVQPPGAEQRVPQQPDQNTVSVSPRAAAS